MNQKSQNLAFHLAIAVAMKLAFLMTLWWLFFHDTSVHLDAEQVADNISGKIISKGVTK